ncbi:hypothetical protein QYE76_043267 [Lolium multiflorum]|uniref:Fe2OG dioxygenase domain-containing protein n=1 Tax=Lolium multiflorum TaxID=4521 RepID=A0AAD8TGT9_LOLMU|nr:hypothetical protein QYE76_043267 [Lolium multiflorum]
MVVANTLFRKRESHLVTFSSGLHSSQIDFVLSRREDRRACIDCKVIPGESVVPQHKLVVADFRFRIRVQRGKRAKVARTKWWKLKGEASQAFRDRVIKEGPWEEGGDANMMWTSMATCLRKVAVEEFGVTKGSRREAKDTWWWNDEVQKVIREKKDCFRCLYLDRSAANMEKYKVAKKAAKRAVSEARGRAYEDLYQRLNTKEGERDIYKMAKFRERKTRDVNEVKCIKDGDDQLLVKDEAIKRRWREYFDNLYNGEAESSTIELDDSFDDTSMCFVRRIQESEVKEALRRMKGGKAMGPDGIPIEAWRGLGDVAIVKPEVISWKPRIIVFHNFLSSEECDYLREIARPRLEISTVVDVATGKGVKSDVRTSSGMFVNSEERKRPVIQAIEKRISVFSQIPVENGELIQVLRYEPSQYYRPHHDYFSDTFNLKRGGQRVATMLMYLTDGVEGGETHFPQAGDGECSCGGTMLKGLCVKPNKGDAVLFWSMGLDGNTDLSSLHSGCPVLEGEKWSATKWMRQKMTF